jgi:hypothetical protein
MMVEKTLELASGMRRAIRRPVYARFAHCL